MQNHGDTRPDQQENNIDIWVRAHINGEMHDVLIEDKYYSRLHDNQLERYRTYFDGILDEYLKESKRHYVILSCKNKAETSDYEGYGGDNELKPSGSDIFDEFWINW